MLWKRVPLGDGEKRLRKTQTEPYRYRKSGHTSFFTQNNCLGVFLYYVYTNASVYICNIKLLEHLAYFISCKGKLLTRVEVLRKYIDIMPEFYIPKCQK